MSTTDNNKQTINKTQITVSVIKEIRVTGQVGEYQARSLSRGIRAETRMRGKRQLSRR